MERTRKPTDQDVQRETIQIIPADNWIAQYHGESSGTTNEPLACWALVREGGNRSFIVGVVAGDVHLLFADLDEEFVGYTQVKR